MMSHRALLEMQVLPQVGPQAANSICRKKFMGRRGHVNRESLLLGLVALLISVAFVITAFVYYFQLQGQWAKDFRMLQEKVEQWKHINIKLTEDILKLQVANKNQSDALKSAMELINEQYHNQYATLLDKINKAKTAHDKEFENIAATIEELEQSDSNLSAVLKVATEELNLADSKNAMALRVESEERSRADLNNSRMLQENVEQWKHINIKWTEDIRTLEGADKNQSDALKSAMEHVNEQIHNQFSTLSDMINKTKTAHEKGFKNVTATIEELEKSDSNRLKIAIENLKLADAKNMMALQMEIGERRRADFNNSRMLQEKVDQWQHINIKLTEDIHTLQGADKNQSDDLKSAMQRFKEKNHDQYSTLSNMVNRTKIAHEKDLKNVAATIQELEQSDSNQSARLETAIKELKLADAKHIMALQIESEERAAADLNNSGMVQEKVYQWKNINIKLTEDIHTLQGADKNQSEALKSAMKHVKEQNRNQYATLLDKINKTKSAHEKEFKNVAATIEELEHSDSNQSVRLKIAIEELKQADAKNMVALQHESQERAAADLNNSRMVQENVDQWKHINIKLTEDVRTLQGADVNQSDALKSAMEHVNEQIRNKYATLSDKINKTKTAHEKEFKNVAATIEELKQSDSNQSDELKFSLARINEQNQQQHLTFSDKINRTNTAYQRETVRLKSSILELKLAAAKKENQFEDGFNQLKSSQSNTARQIENILSRIRQNEASQSGTIETVQSKIGKLNRVITLLTGWKGDAAATFYKKFNDKVNYRTAASRCQASGGRLAAKSIRDANTLSDIIAAGYFGSTSVWIGYDDIEIENGWRWSDGGSTNSRTTKWNRGEPNNAGNEDCAEATSSEGVIHLNDASCSANRAYICEIDVNLEPGVL